MSETVRFKGWDDAAKDKRIEELEAELAFAFDYITGNQVADAESLERWGDVVLALLEGKANE